MSWIGGSSGPAEEQRHRAPADRVRSLHPYAQLARIYRAGPAARELLSAGAAPGEEDAARKDVMGSLIAAAGALWIAVIMWDAFEAIVLPRRVTRRLRPARMFYRVTWRGGGSVARRMGPGGRRATLLPLFGPPSLLLLFSPPGAHP